MKGGITDSITNSCTRTHHGVPFEKETGKGPQDSHGSDGRQPPGNRAVKILEVRSRTSSASHC